MVATHSPLVLASAEPWFDPAQDAWFDLDLEGDPPEVVLRKRAFTLHGSAGNWLTSEAFDLPTDRGSVPAEEVILRARAIPSTPRFRVSRGPSRAQRPPRNPVRPRPVLGTLECFRRTPQGRTVIPVQLAKEPDKFDEEVRRRGKLAILELSGQPSSRTRGKPFKQVSSSPSGIPASKFPPYWRSASPDLLTSYQRVCAYLCLYIPAGTGAPSVDHMRPKSLHWHDVYEWSNYRLACSYMNAAKSNRETVLDPFDVTDEMFALELYEYQIVPGRNIDAEARRQVEATLDALRLNGTQCCDARRAYGEAYRARDVSHRYLLKHAAFVAREFARQDELHLGDR